MRLGPLPRSVGHSRSMTSQHIGEPALQATVVGLFESREQAERALGELQRLGFRADQLGLALRGGAPPIGAGTPGEPESGERPALNTGSGEFAAGDIPGLGPVRIGGLLTGILGGAAAGAVAGGLLGSLVALGLPETAARRCARAFQAGRALVLVQANGRATVVDALLHRHGATDVQHARVEPEGDVGNVGAGPPRTVGGQEAHGTAVARAVPGSSPLSRRTGPGSGSGAAGRGVALSERTARAEAPVRPIERAGTAAWCRYCGAWQTGRRLRVLDPSGEPREWRLCDYCWALLEVGLQAHRPGEDPGGFYDPHGQRLTSKDVYTYIREGFVRGMRSGH
jgi:hypothetical protein